MMRRAALIAFAITVLAVFFLPFSAIGEEKADYFTSKAGFYFPESDELEEYDVGFNGEFAFGHYFNPNFALELGLGFLETDANYFGSDPTWGNFTRYDDFMVIPLTLTAKAIYPVTKKVEIFGEAGGGLYYADAERDIFTTLAGDLLLDDSDTPFGVRVGLGLNYYIVENLAFGLQGGYFWADAEFEYSGAEFEVDLDGFLVTAGLTYYFGVEREIPPPEDSDGDGVYDDQDKCPNTPAGVNVDMSGCPLDADGDGVFDDQDKCPNTPAGVNVDRSGCPLDADGDGVYDDQDKCPNTPAGVNVDRSGCPLDADGDGIYDDQDQCPDTPKGVKVDQRGCPLDTDGDGVIDYKDRCPDTPQGATVDQRGCWVLKGIKFDTAKWDIKPVGYKVLDEVISILKENPGLMLEIQGHTDNRGSAEYNQKLSEKRAHAVMEYFVGKGIAQSRLDAVGYGLSKPAASNDTPQGRAQNRRVELKPIR